MTILARLLAAILALLFLGLGLLYLIFPDVALAHTALSATDTSGSSHVRAAMGAPLLMFGMLMLSGAVRARSEHILMVMIFLVFSLIGRALGIFFNGADPQAMRLVIATGLILLICAFSYFVLMRYEARVI